MCSEYTDLICIVSECLKKSNKVEQSGVGFESTLPTVGVYVVGEAEIKWENEKGKEKKNEEARRLKQNVR